MAFDNKRPIARYNERITIRKNKIVTDKYRNESCVWMDYYSCFAYASTYQFDQESESETTQNERTITFEVRCCPELNNLDSISFRVLFGNDFYDIISVDMMNYQKRKIQIRCKLEKQGDK